MGQVAEIEEIDSALTKKIPDTKVHHQAGPTASGSKSWTHRCSGNLHMKKILYIIAIPQSI